MRKVTEDEILAIIMSRRSIRKFKLEPVADEYVRKLLEAGRWAPSGGNRQPWCFIVVQEPKVIRMIKMFAPGLLGTPPLIIVACIEKPISTADIFNVVSIMDVAMASENILLAATALRLGSCVVKSFNKSAIRELLEIPPQIDPMLLISVGLPNEKPSPPPKKSLAEISFKDKYGTPY